MSLFSNRPRLRRARAALAAGLLVAAVLPSTAGAHAILVRSDPPAGARLAAAPARIVLRFSEAYLKGTEHVSLRRADGTEVGLGRPQGRGAEVDQPLPAGLRGVFVASWRVVSDDGHLSAGEFAFAVGTAGALPSVSGSSSPTEWTQVVVSWLFFAGLALAFGGILSELLVWRRAGPRAPVEVGIAVATLTSLVLPVLLAGARVGGGFAEGLHWRLLSATFGTRPGALSLAVLGEVIVAGLFVTVGRARVYALAPLAAAAVMTSARGHAGTSGHWWAPVVDSIHLLTAAAWAGALAHLVLAVLRAPDRAAASRQAVSRYSRLALPTVLVVLTSGVLSAFAEFRSVGSVFRTGYGQTLIVKAGLVLAALAAASAGRLVALPANPGFRLPLLRRLTTGESLLVVAVLAAVGLLVNLAPPRASSAAAPPATSAFGPPPVDGPAVRLAGFAGRTAVGLAATADELQFLVLTPAGRPPPRFRLTAAADGPGGQDTDLFPRRCGAGCFTMRYRLGRGTTHVTATLSRPGVPAADVTFAVTAPVPRDQTRLLRRVEAAMRAARDVAVTERLGDGARAPGAATTYHLTGAAYLAAQPFDQAPLDVRAIGGANGLTELAYASGDAQTWSRILVDRSGRLRSARIVAPGLLVRRTFRYRTGPPPLPAAGPVDGKAIPTGPFVSAREDGDLAVGFAAAPAGAGRLRLTATVIGPDGYGADGLELTARLVSSTAASARAAACGRGCYAAAVPFTGTPRTALVTVRRLGHLPTVVRFAFPSTWPPPSGEAIAAAATRVFERLRTVTIDERLGSSPTNVRHTIWQLEAPNRLTYDIEGGPDAVVIGNRRWDRDDRGAPWVASPQLPVKQPTPAWVSAPRRATLLGSGTVRGRPVWLVSFVQPDVPAWFTVRVDKQTLRVLELRMTAAAHFMHHFYAGFDAPLKIAPPR